MALGAATRAGRETAGTGKAVEPEALVATWWFDAGPSGDPYSATVRFSGRRVGVLGSPKAADSFTKDEIVDGIVPGTGPVSITTWVYGLQPGEWDVDADVVHVSGGGAGGRPAFRSRPGGIQSAPPASWSWRRWAIATREVAPVRTRWALLAPMAMQPAVLPGIYTALAIVGFVAALGLQAFVLAGRDMDVGQPLAASVIALLAGLVGAKAWYAVLHPGESLIRGGWAVDGFLVVAPLVAAALLYAWDLPVGVVLDATAPGIFFAVALGRVGCFVTGCCAGQCTASRWGIWSSDRRVGARRIPAQLIESGAGLVIGIVSLALVLAAAVPLDGGVFVVAFAAYAVIRQLLLRLRAERRKSYRTLPITAVAAGVVVAVVAALSALQSA
ncbi:MAG: hypothetical protein A2V84_11880 [Chloroflexi bacterium RBG_16_70_13]|nr:MAG: hypothetical protein A2V84_11880 [Chloroflexi bacterium RBG_16_70_13]